MKRKQSTYTKRENKSGTTRLLFAVSFLLFLAFSSGCGNKFFDPTQVGRFRPTPAVNVILDSLGVAEETPLAWEDAEEPKPIDTIVMENDYRFMAGDIVSISIFELLQENQYYANSFVVTETGKISIPQVGVLDVEGLTETQVEEEIRQILSPSVLKEPSVVVTLYSSQQRTFSILGNGVASPGRYVIPRYGFKLADALALAQGPYQFNVSYIYVSRSEKGADYNSGIDVPLMRPRNNGAGRQSEQDMLEIIAPRVQRSKSGSKYVVSSAEFANYQNGGGDIPTIGSGQGWPTTNGWSNQANSNQGSGNKPANGAEDENVSVSDLLKTLSKQPARQSSTVSTDTSIYRRPMNQNSTLNNRAAGSGQTTTDDILKSLSERPVRSATPSGQLSTPNTTRRTMPGSTSRAPNGVSVDDLLDSLSSQPGTGMGERADVDEVLKSFAEPEEQRPRGDMDDVLRSLSQPESGVQMTEQMPLDDVDLVRPREQDATVAPSGTAATSGRIEWIFKDGKWVPLQVGQPVEPEPSIRIEQQHEVFTAPSPEVTTPEVEWGQGSGSRLIRIPADKLLAGDPRYNIVIKPGDTIHVPVDIVGEFCIMGNVNGQGYINITGRPMTLKMAIAAAGGLGPLAMPKKVEVVRRIGKKKEEIVMVDLDKIASGEQPDFFIKPNDLVNVGTDATARWRAVLRNAFRATYGFGFVYDRNFADRDYYTSRPWPF